MAAGVLLPCNLKRKIDLGMKNNYERELMNELRMKGKLELAEVVEMLQISESTARR